MFIVFFCVAVLEVNSANVIVKRNVSSKFHRPIIRPIILPQMRTRPIPPILDTVEVKSVGSYNITKKRDNIDEGICSKSKGPLEIQRYTIPKVHDPT